MNAITSALTLDYVIEAYVQLCQNSGLCDQLTNIFETTEACKQDIAGLLPIALPLLAGQPRDWMNTFCTGWGCEAWDPTTAAPLK